MTMTIKHKRMIMDTICGGSDTAVRVVGHTNDIKRGWFNTNFETGGSDQ